MQINKKQLKLLSVALVAATYLTLAFTHYGSAHHGVDLFTVANPVAGLKPQPIIAKTDIRAVPAPASECADNQQAKAVIVSISKQHLWACAAPSTVQDSAVTTGMTVVKNGVDDHTPTGSWQIAAKYTNLHLRGRDANGSWDDPVQYWLPFDGDIGFHDAAWQTFAFGSDQYTTDGSHGCVHLPLPTIQWLYSWASVGTTVTIEN